MANEATQFGGFRFLQEQLLTCGECNVSDYRNHDQILYCECFLKSFFFYRFEVVLQNDNGTVGFVEEIVHEWAK